MPFAARTFRFALIGVALAVGSSVSLADGSVERGRQIAYTCLGCHGIENYKNAYPSYRVPKLAGQHVTYLAAALKAYQSRERSHATMHSHAIALSEQDMADIAAYLAGETELKPGGKPVGTPPKSAAVCVACHGNDGIGITPDYPNLAGQHPDYLERTLRDYKLGARKNAVMAGFAATLSDADIEALSEYYAAQRPGLKTRTHPLTRFSLR